MTTPYLHSRKVPQDTIPILPVFVVGARGIGKSSFITRFLRPTRETWAVQPTHGVSVTEARVPWAHWSFQRSAGRNPYAEGDMCLKVYSTGGGRQEARKQLAPHLGRRPCVVMLCFSCTKPNSTIDYLCAELPHMFPQGVHPHTRFALVGCQYDLVLPTQLPEATDLQRWRMRLQNAIRKVTPQEGRDAHDSAREDHTLAAADMGVVSPAVYNTEHIAPLHIVCTSAKTGMNIDEVWYQTLYSWMCAFPATGLARTSTYCDAPIATGAFELFAARDDEAPRTREPWYAAYTPSCALL